MHVRVCIDDVIRYERASVSFYVFMFKTSEFQFEDYHVSHDFF